MFARHGVKLPSLDRGEGRVLVELGQVLGLCPRPCSACRWWRAYLDLVPPPASPKSHLFRRAEQHVSSGEALHILQFSIAYQE